MKILYGVQGTGNGHITRARVMAEAFAQRPDVKVDYVFSGRDKTQYFDMQIFGDYQTYSGLSFKTRGGKISKYATCKAANICELVRDIKTLPTCDYDLVINDFEPISAWAAKLSNTPSISISHQAAFLHPIPKHTSTLFDRAITKYFAPTDIQLGVHWYHFGHPIMPPFIDAKELRGAPSRQYLVYLPFEDLEDIEGLLDPLAEYEFICFHPGVTAQRKTGHITWCPVAKDKFARIMQNCSGVIANAGFELASECLHFGKKLLIKPLAGQFEQLSNAQTLVQLGLCLSMCELDGDIVEDWLQMPANEPIKFPQNPAILIDWLIAGNWQSVDKLCEQLWQNVCFSPSLGTQLDNLYCSSRS
ncbi:MAG: hypothetical protein ACJA13_000392 [Paraglaciecola sp.]|jgi:uncharacterized protein (TIGR00661 family)